MPISTLVYSADYPRSGWSAWFGCQFPRLDDGGLPYGFVFKTVGSTGLFTPLNAGKVASLAPINDLDKCIYRIDFKAPGATGPANITFTPNGLGEWIARVNYLFTTNPPFWEYFSEETVAWATKRETLFLDGPTDHPVGYPGRAGDLAACEPLNYRRFGQLTGIS